MARKHILSILAVMLTRNCTPGKENNKLFMVIPGASHCDLYDQKDIIPFDAIETFFKEYLN